MKVIGKKAEEFALQSYRGGGGQGTLVSVFYYAVYIAHSFPSKEQVFSTFMVDVNICSDFGA